MFASGGPGPTHLHSFGFLLDKGDNGVVLRIKGLVHRKYWNQHTSTQVSNLMVRVVAIAVVTTTVTTS